MPSEPPNGRAKKKARQSRDGDNATVSSSVLPPPRPPEFTLFPTLPRELRDVIWRYTLDVRVVEIEFDKDKGFFSHAKIPTALKVCQDSRQAVVTSYNVCFGSVWYHPHILFNFDLDTVYIDIRLVQHIPIFFSVLSREEMSRIRYVAIDVDLELAWDYGWNSGLVLDLFGPLKEAVESVTALAELDVVFELESWTDESIAWWHSSHRGSMQLFNRMPPAVFERLGDAEKNNPYYQKTSWNAAIWRMEDKRLLCLRMENGPTLPSSGGKLADKPSVYRE